MSKQGALILLILIVVVAVGLRSYQLTARSLWFDEAFSWRLIQFPVTELVARTAADVHPPLYYFLLKGWSVVFGSSLISLRSFSVMAAATSIAAAYLFTSSAARSRWAGLLAATLIALSGWQIQFAWEARMYTLGVTLALLSSWALLRAMRAEPQRLGWWGLYVVLATAFAYVHYYAFFTLAAHGLFVVGYCVAVTGGRVFEILNLRRFWYALGAAATSVVLYLPWIPTFLRQNSQVQDSYWIPPIGGWSIPDTFYRMLVPTSAIPSHTGVGWILLALVPMVVVIAFLSILALLSTGRARTRDAQWFVVTASALPFFLSIGISLVSQSLYQDRFFIFAHPFILIALAFALSRIPWALPRRALISLVVFGFVAATVQFWYEVDIPAKPGVRAAVAHIYESHDKQAPVVVSSPFIYFAVLHYALEDFAAPAAHLYSENGSLSHFAGEPILKSSDVVGPTIFTAPTSTIWVVTTTGFGGSTLTPPAPWRASETYTYPEVFAHQGEVSVTKYIR